MQWEERACNCTALLQCTTATAHVSNYTQQKFCLGASGKGRPLTSGHGPWPSFRTAPLLDIRLTGIVYVVDHAIFISYLFYTSHRICNLSWMFLPVLAHPVSPDRGPLNSFCCCLSQNTGKIIVTGMLRSISIMNWCLLLGLHTYSVTAFCFGRCVCLVCLSRIRSRKLSEIGMKFRHLYRKSGLPSKNMMSYFALEVAK